MENVLDQLRAYHPDRTSLLLPEQGPSLFGQNVALSADAVCAELSRLAYTRFECGQGAKLQAALTAGGFGQAAVFAHGGTQAFAVKSGQGAAFVAFRGTQADDPTDIVTDVRFALDADARFPGQVHTGFVAGLDEVWDAVNDWKEANAKGAALTVTGHSLGAALATLAASRWPQARLVTFGSPRVGDADFARSFEGRDVKRYVDCSDVVTRVPPEIGFLQHRYAHVCAPTVIDALGRIMAVTPNDEQQLKMRFQAGLEYEADYAFHLGTVGVRDLADHAPANYIRAFLA